MKEVEITNPEFLEMMDEWLWFFKNHDKVDKTIHLSSRYKEPYKNDADYWTNHDMLNRVMREGKGHLGYPESCRAYTLKPDQAPFKIDSPDLNEVNDKYSKCNEDMMCNLASRHNALSTLYPPGGWMSWHNNANAAAYNLLFSWSETGDGYFEYYDMKEQRVVRLQDKPGWQCRYGYFGSYEDSPEKLVYHAARTNCWRMTVSYIYHQGDHGTSFDIQQEIINEIVTS
jgi:hypothetical protein